MRIAIHLSCGYFSERWIEYCESTGVAYKVVDCYKNDIIEQVSDCDALMWHFNHKSPRASKFAKQLLYAIQHSGKVVFPNFNTVWHFDDKIGQKYLFEALNIPIPNSYIFYNKRVAMEWACYTDYPKVFKLRNGSASDNVRKVNSKKDALVLIKKAFGSGFRQYKAFSDIRERYRLFRLGKSSLLELLKGFIRIVYTTEYARVTGREKGYAYFQDFIPGNSFDIRVIVIGGNAFGIKRLVRENDFRASGSGMLLYSKEEIPIHIVSIAFEISERLNVQCMAYDFVLSGTRPLLLEMSFGFSLPAYDHCLGYWDKSLQWHEGRFNPYGWMIEDIKSLL